MCPNWEPETEETIISAGKQNPFNEARADEEVETWFFTQTLLKKENNDRVSVSQTMEQRG